MNLRKYLILPVIAFTLLGCKDERPPFWSQVCTKSETSISLMYTGKSWMPIPVNHCVKWTWSCSAGRDFNGPFNCPLPKPKDGEK